MVSAKFDVKNIGEAGSKLDWYVDSAGYPSGATFYPSSDGEDLTPEDGPVTVTFRYTLPDEDQWSWNGYIIVYNSEDCSDNVEITLTLETSKNKQVSYPVFAQFLDKFPFFNQFFLQFFNGKLR